MLKMPFNDYQVIITMGQVSNPQGYNVNVDNHRVYSGIMEKCEEVKNLLLSKSWGELPEGHAKVGKGVTDWLPARQLTPELAVLEGKPGRNFETKRHLFSGTIVPISEKRPFRYKGVPWTDSNEQLYG
jgi:hypothetical protein